jgi:2-methylcitrate dehydratase PrpD
MEAQKAYPIDPKGNELAGRFIATTRWGELPEIVQHKAKLCLIDDVGATLAGTLTRVSQITAEYAAQAWRGDQATILLHGKRATPVGAAFANAWAANGIDIDDGAQYAYGHAGAQIFPASLAVAEARGLDGARLLAALVVGYEVAHRVGRCWHDHHEIYQACGSWGSVASAAAAANLMDLTPEGAQHALGIAEYHAPNLPMMRDIDHPAMVKHGIGWGAMTGVMSAELASVGFTGIPSILGFEVYQDWVSDFGSEYLMVDGVAWKRKGFACCSWAHAAMDGAYSLVRQHEIALEDIAAIQVEGFHETVRLGTRLPSTTEEAQFNVAWPLAAMLVDGEVGPNQTLEPRLNDPQIAALAQKVQIHESDELNELCRLYELGDPRGRFASIVTITLTDGRVFNSGLVEANEQHPPVGWDDDRIADKFRWLVGHVLDESQVEGLLETLCHFDDVFDVREFTRVLA